MGKSVVTVTDKRTVHTDALDILGRKITDEDNIGRDAIHLAVEPVVAGQRLFAAQEVGRMADGTFGTNNVTKYLGIVDPFLAEPVYPGEKFLLVIYPRQITTLRHVWEHPEFGPDVVNPATIKAETRFHVILKNSGPNKINTIKAVREITSLGLKDSKDLTDSCPSFVGQNLTLDQAKIMVDHLNKVSDAVYVEATELTPTLTKYVANPNKPAPAPALSHAEQQAIYEKKVATEWITEFAQELKKSESWDESEAFTFQEMMDAANAYVDHGEHAYIGNSDIYDVDWATFWKHYKTLTGKEPEEEYGFFSCSC